MRHCGRAVVIKDGNLLVMKRFKIDREYYTLLGGAINPGEAADEAAVREVFEESGVTVASPRHIYTEEAGDPFGNQYIFYCDYISGEPKLPDASEEAFWTTPGKNTYEPMWLPFTELDNVPFVSPFLKEKLIKARSEGFPEQPQTFSSKHAERLS